MQLKNDHYIINCLHFELALIILKCKTIHILVDFQLPNNDVDIDGAKYLQVGV